MKRLLSKLRVFIKYSLHFLARNMPVGDSRQIFYKMMGVRIKGTVSIGSDVWIDEYFPARITIEDGAFIAPRVTIVAHQGPGKVLRKSRYPFFEKDVLIKEGAWIGAGAIILPGVTIGKYSVIAAGSVVRANVPDNTLAAGVPARNKKFFEDFDQVNQDNLLSNSFPKYEKINI